MMPKRTMRLVFAAACLTAIAAIPAHAQPASTYGSPPGYTTPQGAATYGSPPGYTTPQGSAAYGSPPGYTTPQGSAAYGATPGQQPYTPQASEGDVPQSTSARRNVIESRQYDRELETNRAFRQARMRKECDPISDPELRQSCLASFHQDEPSAGSSSSSRAHRSGSGR